MVTLMMSVGRAVHRQDVAQLSCLSYVWTCNNSGTCVARFPKEAGSCLLDAAFVACRPPGVFYGQPDSRPLEPVAEWRAPTGY